MKQYNALVLEHFWQPRHVGAFAEEQKDVFTGKIGNPGIGDVLQLQLQVEQNLIKAAKFKAYGNPYIIAGCSIACERLPGLSIEEAQQINHRDFVDALNLPQTKLYCALLIEDVIKAAIATIGDKT